MKWKCCGCRRPCILEDSYDSDGCNKPEVCIFKYNTANWVPCDNVPDVTNEEKFDDAEHPAHYLEGRKYEPRLVAEDWGLIDNGYLFSAFKYLSRMDRKGDEEDAIKDLKKIRNYINFEIERRERNDH